MIFSGVFAREGKPAIVKTNVLALDDLELVLDDSGIKITVDKIDGKYHCRFCEKSECVHIRFIQKKSL
jgi:hypothetical protein